MNGWVERFDEVLIPGQLLSWSAGTGGMQGEPMRLVGGGVYDPWPGEDAAPAVEQIRVRCAQVGTSQIAVMNAVDALRAKWLQRGQLFVRMADDSARWRWARLASIPSEWDVGQWTARFQRLEFLFWPDAPFWNGWHHGVPLTWASGISWGDGHNWGETGALTLDQSLLRRVLRYTVSSGTLQAGERVSGGSSGATGWVYYHGDGLLCVDGVSGTFQAAETITGALSGATLTVSGTPEYWLLAELESDADRDTEDAEVTVSVPLGGTALTKLGLSVSGLTEILWTGTIAAGTSLVINCGAPSVRNAGSNAYSTLTRSSHHTICPWLRIARATTTRVIVTYAGGGGTSTILFDYWEKWA